MQIDALLLSDLFESLRNKCKEIRERSFILSVRTWISMAGMQEELELLTDVDLLLMVENGIRGGMFHAIDQYAKDNNKYMKDYDTSKKPSYLMYGNISNSCRWSMSQKLTAGGFKWRKILFRFD